MLWISQKWPAGDALDALRNQAVFGAKHCC